jgi:hypothetical protein
MRSLFHNGGAVVAARRIDPRVPNVLTISEFAVLKDRAEEPGKQIES